VEAKKKYEELATIDYLTQLPNRFGLYEYYNSLKTDEPINVMFFDIDNFKKVNDTYGHHIGDELLIAVSNKVSETVKGAFVSRIGGDEFVVVLTGERDRNGVIEVAQTILGCVDALDISVDVKAVISLSIGVILNQVAQNNLDELLYKCDAAMYQAKKNGKNAYVIYDDIEKELNFKKAVETEMKAALEQGQFQVYFQPQVNMINTKMVGAEALVRWVHPTGGVRKPKQFLHILEENGFVISMDMYVFEEVCKLRKKWKGTSMATIPTGVNMSKLHMYRYDFVDKLKALVDKYELSTSEFIIEFSEIGQKDVNEGRAVVGTINRLKEEGFSIALDDFGSGDASLSILKMANVDMIKLGEAFFQNSDTDRKSKVIIKHLISMVKELKLSMVIEGVVSKNQERFLVSSGGDTAQGYYYSEPLTVDCFEKYTEEHMQRKDKIITYHFNNNLLDENGENEGNMIGTVEYAEGILKTVGSLHFMGGAPMKNVIYLPSNILCCDSHTISMWIKVEKLNNWTSVLMGRADNGFMSIMPYAWERVPMYRAKDEWDENGWYDALGKELTTDEWVHLCVTFNSKTSLARIYQNGVITGKRDNMFELTECTILALGGDYYQESLTGFVSELSFYNYAKTEEEVMELYMSYVNSPDFNGNK